MKATRFLVVGGDGLLGKGLSTRWIASGHEVVATTRRMTHAAPTGGIQRVALDLAADPAAWPIPPGVHTAVLCAAVTRLETCRRHPAETRLVNVAHTVQLAQRLAGHGCFVVFLSTNLVFSGTAPRVPAVALPAPKTEYGRQKAEAELALGALRQNTAVLRLTKVLHPDMPLLQSWRAAFQKGEVIRPFSDVVCAPLTPGLVLSAISALAERRLAGLWQLSADLDISYADIALRLAERCGVPRGKVQPISWRAAAPDLEHVPEHTTLDATPLCRELRIPVPPTALSMDQVVSALDLGRPPEHVRSSSSS